MIVDRGKQITGLICLVLLVSCCFAWAFEIKDSNTNVLGGQARFAGSWQSATEALEYSLKLQQEGKCQ